MYEQELDHEMSKTDDRPPGWALRERIKALKASISKLEGNQATWAARMRQQCEDSLRAARAELIMRTSADALLKSLELQRAADAEADSAEDWADNFTVDSAGQLARKGSGR